MAKAKTILIIVFIIFSSSGCLHSDDDKTKQYQAALDRNITLWNNGGISSYTYTWNVYCFCLPQDDIIVTVTSGTISGAFYSPSGTSLTAYEITRLFTIEDLFDRIQEAIDSRVALLQVTYNRDYGYPESIYIDRLENAVDEEVTYSVSNFQ